MESQEYFGFGVLLIVIGVGAYFGGQYINSDFWLILQYGDLSNMLLNAGPVIAILGVLVMVLGIFQMYNEKKTPIKSSVVPTILKGGEKDAEKVQRELDKQYTPPPIDEKTQIKYCGNCGTPNPIDNNYCEKCGKKIG